MHCFSVMALLCSILLLVMNVCFQSFIPAGQPADHNVNPSDKQSEYYLRQADCQPILGIQGESVICVGGCIHSPASTQFSCGNQRVQFGKNRTRTSFLRRMLHLCQSHLIVYHGIERRESSPFAVSTGRAYYIYALRRILC